MKPNERPPIHHFHAFTLKPVAAAEIRDLPRAFLLAQLKDYFHTPPSDKIVETDYALWRCAETGLEFCEPPLPGNAAFYEWVSSFPSYYPGYRWEYGQVAGLIQEEKKISSPDFKVLDVGCGKGDFLRALNFLSAPQKYALDLNEPAIRACREQGFKAFCGTVETAIAAGFLQPGEFPVVTAFHCLEHVPQPVEFCRELAPRDRARRKIIFEHALFADVIRGWLVRRAQSSAAPSGALEPGGLPQAGGNSWRAVCATSHRATIL